MSIRDHLESQDVYLPRGCRRTEDAADRLRAMLTKAEDERDAAREEARAWQGEADLLAYALRRNSPEGRDLALECYEAFCKAITRREVA